MKRFFLVFLLVALFLFLTFCQSNTVKNERKKSIDKSVSVNDFSINNDLTSDNESEVEEAKFDTHYDSDWWKVSDEYKSIVDDMLNKGFYLDERYINENPQYNINTGFKLSVLDDGKECESSCTDDIFASFTGYWFINDVRIANSARMMFVPKDGITFCSSLQKIFEDAIEYRRDFNRSPDRFQKDVIEVNNKIILYSNNEKLCARGFDLDVKSYRNQVDIALEKCDRLFIVTSAYKDSSEAHVIFSCLIEASNNND